MIDAINLNNNQTTFLPMELAVKYYKKWDCEIQTKQDKNGYYKCLQGEGEVYFDNNNHFKGKFVNGLMHGIGRFQWSNGLIYEGMFQNNSITGKGKYKWPDGSAYQGMLINGKREGKGEYFSTKDQSKYYGDWKNGLRDGYGSLSFKSEASYEGQFKNGFRHGKGKMKYASGNEYQGNWINDKKQGYGIMNWYNAHQKYQGQWKNDQQNGLGTYYWFDGKIEYKIIKNIYKGYWINGQRNGFGCFYYSNGCRFEGNFCKNQKNGLGIVMDQNGYCKVEQYKDDKVISQDKNKQQKQDQSNQLTTNKVATPRLQQKLKLPEIKKTVGIKQNQKDQNNVFPINNNQLVSKQKEITENQYKRIVDLGSFSQKKLIDQKILNYLLRENSKLRAWYKHCSSSSAVTGPIKQFYTGMISQNLWKLIKDLKLVDQFISIAKLNRDFSKSSKSSFDMSLPNCKKLALFEKYEVIKKNSKLSTSTEKQKFQNQYFTSVSYSEIQWVDYCLQLKQSIQAKTTQKEMQKVKLIQQIELNQQISIHDNKRIILFRQFVCFLLKIAILQYQRDYQKIQRKQKLNNLDSQLFRQKLQNLFNTIHKFYLQQSQIKQKEKLPFSTDNLTLQSNQKSAAYSEDYQKINSQIFRDLTKNQKSLTNTDDRTVTVRVLYGLLDKCQILKDSNQKILFLQKIERSMTNSCQSVLKKQMKQYFSVLQKVVYKSPIFQGILNYSLVEKQFSDLIYQAVNRRIHSNNKQETLKKYKQLITYLKTQIQKAYEKVQTHSFAFKKIRSQKDRQKEQLWKKHQKQLLQQKQKQFKKLQEQKQGRQRLKMQRQDFRWQEKLIQGDQQSQQYFD